MFEDFIQNCSLSEGGGKSSLGAIGYYSPNIPEELIHASGLTPVRVFGTAGDTSDAEKYFPIWCCNYSKRTLQDAIQGKYDWLKGFVGSKYDDTALQLYIFWKYVNNPEFFYLLQTPILRTSKNLDYYVEDLKRFKDKLENYTDREIRDRDIIKSIKIYNENRELLRNLYELRKDKGIKSTDVLKAVISSMTMPKEKHNKKLSSFIEKNKNINNTEKENVPTVHISGTEIHDPSIFELIEESGVRIVSDDLNTGTTYFWEDVREDKNPIESIAERYLYGRTTDLHITEQGSIAADEKVSYIEKLVNHFGVDGVIILADRGCEAYGHTHAYMESELDNRNIDNIYVDYDIPITRKQMELRLEAFAETLKEKN